MKTPDYIGKYRVIRELGKGATGAVYLAEDTFKHRSVAIKLMFPEVLKDAEDGELYRRMFLNEVDRPGGTLAEFTYDAILTDVIRSFHAVLRFIPQLSTCVENGVKRGDRKIRR